MARNVKSYFEHHAHSYSDRHVQFYSRVADYIIDIMTASKKKENRYNVNDSNCKIRLLDVGCGNGSFVKAFINAQQRKKVKSDNNNSIGYHFLATDMSFEMIKLAKQNLSQLTNHHKEIDLFVSYAFNLPIQENKKFDIIHIDSVLHHLVDTSRHKSTILAKKLLEILAGMLSDNQESSLIVEEWHFLSYVIASFSSSLIFYGLKLINFLKLDLSFTSEIRQGLEVNFLSPKQLYEILTELCSRLGDDGDVYLFDKTKVKFPIAYRLFLLREKSHSTFLLRLHRKKMA